MRGVTLQEFQKWVKKHENKTWIFKVIDPSFDIKYFDLNFDTRTMDIFRITARGHREIAVHIGDKSDEKTILDELERRLGWKK